MAGYGIGEGSKQAGLMPLQAISPIHAAQSAAFFCATDGSASIHNNWADYLMVGTAIFGLDSVPVI